MTTNPMPKAKTERLIVREIDGETLVYDRAHAAASCLNEFAARVWRACDGETSVAEIAAALGDDEPAVWLAPHQLTKAQQLTEALAFPPNMSAARAAARSRGGSGWARQRSSPASSRPAQAQGCGTFGEPCSGDPEEARVVVGSCLGAFLRLLVRVVFSSNGELLRMARSIQWRRRASRSHSGREPERDPHRDQRRGVRGDCPNARARQRGSRERGQRDRLLVQLRRREQNRPALPWAAWPGD
jgi:Coenzyme PQQ synthesis protein D (PqqD)